MCLFLAIKHMIMISQECLLSKDMVLRALNDLLSEELFFFSTPLSLTVNQ